MIHDDRQRELVKEYGTPLLIMDLDDVRIDYDELRGHFPDVTIYYAVKANPGRPVLRTLNVLGSSFDVASILELRRVRNMGIPAERISYGNTIKTRDDVAQAYAAGVRMFVTDSVNDLDKLRQNGGKDVKVVVRMSTEGSETADWPLSRKFGCSADSALFLLAKAKRDGLIPYGLSFHVGSQQHDIGVWGQAIYLAAAVFRRARLDHGIRLGMLNLGGGLPAPSARTKPLAVYALEINQYLTRAFGSELPKLIMEPGRSLVAGAGTILTSIINVSRRSPSDQYRWVYIDAGVFNGMIETLGEAIKYPLGFESKHRDLNYGLSEEVIIAGPTCDSMDIMYEGYKYKLPLSAREGDLLIWHATGAYTASYASVGFNGFEPITMICE